MTALTFSEYLGPVLEALSDGRERSTEEIRSAVASLTDLPEADRDERLSSGQPRFDNRVAWAITYLLRAGALERPRRGIYRINPRGQELLARDGNKVTLDTLREFEEFRRFTARSAGNQEGLDEVRAPEPDKSVPATTPDERLSEAALELKSKTQADLLEKLLDSSPRFFEQAVLSVLLAIGYGGSRADAGRALGKAGDEGLDGVIREDPLGLDVLYIQAKRWAPTQTVGPAHIREFVGSLEGARAKKGVFITTSSFSQSAREFVHRLDKRVVLIDGTELTRLMFEHSVGVRLTASYEVKEMDEDFFVED